MFCPAYVLWALHTMAPRRYYQFRPFYLICAAIALSSYMEPLFRTMLPLKGPLKALATVVILPSFMGPICWFVSSPSVTVLRALIMVSLVGWHRIDPGEM